MRQDNDIRFPKGFTLIELLVVIALVGILSGGILIALNIGGNIDKARLIQAKKFAAQLENGLAVNQVGKWSFEEAGAGTCSGGGDACDTSGYKNNGAFIGGSTTTASCDNLGLGRCFSLNGTSQHVEMSTRVLNSSGSFTVSVWIRPTALGSSGTYRPIVSEIGSAESGQFNLRITNTGNIQFIRSLDSLPGRILTTNTLIVTNKWYHIVGVHIKGVSSDTLRVYINAIKDSASEGSGNWSTSSSTLTRIGYDVNGYFSGLIDEVQIYKEALTLSQIEKLYAQGLLRKELSLRF